MFLEEEISLIFNILLIIVYIFAYKTCMFVLIETKVQRKKAFFVPTRIRVAHHCLCGVDIYVYIYTRTS